mgnify:CR=1 FL=1
MFRTVVDGYNGRMSDEPDYERDALEREIDDAVGPWGGPNAGPFTGWHLMGGALFAILLVLVLWWIFGW